MATPKLVLRSTVTAATTYSFVTEGEGFHSWALCTVNDISGELLISSDWGSWSYRWHASRQSLGATNLTAFLGERGGVDYLARKLQGRESGARFSARATARALQQRLIERRREAARDQIEDRWDEVEIGRPAPLGEYSNGLPIYTYERDAGGQRIPYFSRTEARRIWNELGELADDLHNSVGAEHVFWDRLQHIEGFYERVTEEPHEYVCTEQSFEDKILRETILPALIMACADTARARRFEQWMTNNPQPPDLEPPDGASS